MKLEERFELIKQVGEEIITEEELKELLKTKKHPVAYDGFEPSGTDIHIAQGLLRAININKLIKAGCKFKILIADWHAWANNKLGGNLEYIKKVGEYYKEVWKACDMNLDNVEFIWASELVKDDNYWKKVMQIARNSTLKRIIRCSQIMGRSEGETLQASQILYPCMQAADIFHLKVDVVQLGMDQRKVNVLAREVGSKLGYWKPVAVHHHMLMGLGHPSYGILSKNKAKAMAQKAESGQLKTHQPDMILHDNEKKMRHIIELKMSKSKPDTAIFMTDSEEDIKRKIKKAYCLEGIVNDNPTLEYCKYIIFEKFDTIEIKRSEKFGGNLTIKSYAELEDIYSERELHPMDLKSAVGKYLNQLLEPIRKKLKRNKTAQKLLEKIKTFKVTR